MPTAHFYMIAVPTPLTDENLPDISYVESAARAIAPSILAGSCVIVESTSPVGTTEKVAQIIAEMRPDLAVPVFGEQRGGDIALAYCPERVLPGKIVRELVQNDRVIGGSGGDVIEGGAGDDTIVGGGHDMNAYGGDGADLLVSNAQGISDLYGGAGADILVSRGGDIALKGRLDTLITGASEKCAENFSVSMVADVMMSLRSGRRGSSVLR